MTATEPGQGVDGRAARSRRTREAIVEAHVELLRAGTLRPTGEQIAARAGVSVRSVWIHFPELEALFAATAAEVLAQQDAAFRPVDRALGLPARIERFCRQRAALLERVAPFARASVLREPTSPTLRDYRRRHVRRVVDEVSVLFEGELARHPQAHRPATLDAVVAATTWGAWATLRDDLGLSRARSRAVMARTVSGLLAEGAPLTPGALGVPPRTHPPARQPQPRQLAPGEPPSEQLSSAPPPAAQPSPSPAPPPAAQPSPSPAPPPAAQPSPPSPAKEPS